MNLETRPRDPLGAWDLFVLRHSKPSNLAIHFVSAVLFFGSPLYGLVTRDWRWFVAFCISGCIGSCAHYVTRDGTVSIREATSSPRVVFYNAKLWWRVLGGTYGRDIATARRKLTAQQAALGRTALITGCSSGFGLAMTRAFLDRGFRVIATARRADDATALQELRVGFGAQLSIVEADLTLPAARRRLIDLVRAQARLDAIVSNASFGVFGALEDVSEADLREHMEVGFFAPALLVRELAPMLRASNGTLVNVSSPAGVSGFPWTSAYCASKHALEGLTESLRLELAPSGINVHLLTPSAHRTSFLRNARWWVPASGPHALGVAAYRAVMEKNQTKDLPDPRAVAEVAADLVERRGYAFRVDVGAHVRVLRRLVRWLPESFRLAFVSFVFARAKSAGAPPLQVARRS